MRRWLAGGLLYILLAQSSGVAVAQTGSTPLSLSGLGAAVTSIQSAITSSLLFAVVMGTQDRYAAMHASPPRMEPAKPLAEAARIMHAEHPLRPRVRHGVPFKIVMPDRSVLDRRHPRLDPLAMRRSSVVPQRPQVQDTLPAGVAFLEPLRALQAPPSVGKPRGALAQPQGNGHIKQTTSTAPGTGIEHWWTYEERAIPGIGKAMVNVGTGNLLVSATDVDVPEQGIDLAFQRVYNSQSLHDANGDDGGDPSIFGNRWTNNLDASIIYNSTNNTMTVYDLDGTACTYTTSQTAPGGWQPCTGEYATLVPTDSTDCTYAWNKPNGTTYWFHADVSGAGCSIPQAKKGQLAEILGRNQNNYITFTYSYNGQGKTSEDITQITVTHSDGDSLTMNFGLVGNSINELATITLPDGYSTLQYSYDSSGNLLEVDKPGNNSAFSLPNSPNGPNPPTGDVPETYAYVSGSSTLQEACGPRCTASTWQNYPNAPTDGGAMLFSFNGSLQLTSWQFQGVLNFTPDDGTNTVLHSGKSTSFVTWYTANFVYGTGSACSGTSSGTTTMCDSDGHGAIWTADSGDRVVQTQRWAGTAENLWIVTSQTWDSSNNLTSTTDGNGFVTSYGYDNSTSLGYDCCGNLVEMQLPQASDFTINGQNQSLSPLSYYSYDGNFNVLAYCDPVYNQSQNNSWVPPANNDGLCPTSGNHARTLLTYATPSAEPFGCLTSVTKPGGYETDVSYPTGEGSACGLGLPAKVQADQQITNYDGSTRTPTQDFSYNSRGDLTNYDKGLGDSGHYQDSWTLAYDGDNRLIQKTNNDPTSTAITSMSCYYPDGSLFYTETPSQWASDGNANCPAMQTMLSGAQSPPQHATAYYYDVDGDQVKLVTHKGCSSVNNCPVAQPNTACKSGTTEPVGTTCKYYDGLDRLVETAEPYDTRSSLNRYNEQIPYEFYTYRWMNRYIYDISQDGGSANLTISDATGTISGLVAYGNLFKTQEYLSQTSNMRAKLLQLGNLPSPGWNDVRGSSYDALGRVVGKYELAYGTTAVTLNTYDCSGANDELCSTTNAAGQVTSYTYDSIGRVKQQTFSGPAPRADGPRSYTYDPDGRPASITGNAMGTLSYTYDVDGNKTSTVEPANEPASSLICYSYYPDGLREYLSIGIPNSDSCGNINSHPNPSNGGIRQANLFSYSYRNDGLLASQQVNWNGVTINAKTPTFSWVYTPSGREQTETDPLYGEAAWYPNGQNSTTLGSKQYSYDVYGRVQGLTMPEPTFTESSFVYDDDDELVSYSASGAFTRQLKLNARGEILKDLSQSDTFSANGTAVGNGDYQSGAAFNQEDPNGIELDERSGMITAIANPFWAKNSDTGPGAGAYVYTYDGAGRQTTATQYPNWPNGGSTTTAYTQTFDGENHIAQTGNTLNFCYEGQINCNNGITATAQWGPDGRQRTASFQGGSAYSAHWDGDALLFYSDGTTARLYIGKDATMDVAGDLDVSDRDQTGEQQTSHAYSVTSPPSWAPNGVWFDSWNVGSAMTVWMAKLNQTKNLYPYQIGGTCGFWGTVANNPVYYACPFYPEFAMARPDGYNMVGGNVQGARIYDPTSAQWLTPDAYAGDVRDPMSQKPFMWNANNPIQWEDPSGYEGCLTGSGLCGGSITPVPANPNSYTQLEVNAVVVTLSITAVNKGLIWSWGVGPGVGSKDGQFKLGVGAGLFSGSFFPNPGKTPEDVGTGPSVGESGGYVFGAQAFGNSNGSALGVGLTTPGFSITETTGTLIKFDWGKLFPVNGAQVAAPPQSSTDKSQTTP